MWTIPAERMKSGKEHRVPLSLPAVALLNAMAAIRQSDLSLLALAADRSTRGQWRWRFARQGRENITVHGFRSTFRDWAAERTTFPREIAEMALAHSSANAVEASVPAQRHVRQAPQADGCVGGVLRQAG